VTALLTRQSELLRAGQMVEADRLTAAAGISVLSWMEAVDGAVVSRFC
jgi:hypothetical protein